MRKVLYTFITILLLVSPLSNLLAQNLINLEDYTTSFGCRGVYIGSYDDVYVLNTIENVTGEALSIDGTPVGACYTEILLSKKIGGVNPEVIASFHPAFLMRQPDQKKYAWEDLKMIRKKIVQLKIK